MIVLLLFLAILVLRLWTTVTAVIVIMILWSCCCCCYFPPKDTVCLQNWNRNQLIVLAVDSSQIPHLCRLLSSSSPRVMTVFAKLFLNENPKWNKESHITLLWLLWRYSFTPHILFSTSPPNHSFIHPYGTYIHLLPPFLLPKQRMDCGLNIKDMLLVLFTMLSFALVFNTLLWIRWGVERG